VKQIDPPTVVEVVMPGRPHCEECGGPTVASLTVTRTGAAMGVEIRHKRLCKVWFCVHGKRVWGPPVEDQEECATCDRIEGRRNSEDGS
jgi:hypothetical protein